MTKLNLHLWLRWMIVIGYFTGDKSNDYKNSIVHRRKEDSLAIWTYNKSNGEIGYSNPPYQPNQVVYRPFGRTINENTKRKNERGFLVSRIGNGYGHLRYLSGSSSS